MTIKGILGDLSVETAIRSGRWVRDNSIGCDSLVEFWEITEPLLTGLIESDKSSLCWATTSVLQGPKAAFHPIGSEALMHDPKWNYRNAIQWLGERREILHTTNMSLSILRDGRPLHLHSELSTLPEEDDDSWHVDLSGMSSRIRERIDSIEPLINELCEDQFEYRALRQLDQILNVHGGGNLPKITPPVGFDTFAQALFQTLMSRGMSGLSRYLAVVAAISNDWTRITMLPTIFSSGHLSFPGGLVICEKESESLLTRKDLHLIQAITSVPFWPWQSTARATDHNELPPTVRHHVECNNNDYRSFEYLFGGQYYTLVDSESRFLQKAHFEGLNDFLGNRLFLPVQDASPEPDSVTDGAEESMESYTISGVTGSRDRPVVLGNELEQERILERRRRIENIRPAFSKISVLVPIVPSIDRLENFRLLIKALGAQSIHQAHKDAIELVVIIDGKDYQGSNCTGRDNPIVQLITNCEPFDHSNLVVIQRKRIQPLGRSDARNVALKYCTGDIVQLIDDSMILHPEYLLEVLVRFEHLSVQKFVLMGFKERLGNEQGRSFVTESVDAMLHGYLQPTTMKDWKCDEEVTEEFVHGSKAFPKESRVNYMEITGDLCFLSGREKLGHRSLPHFFSTGLAALRKEELLNIGGFHHRFSTDWGLEDTFAGCLLVARGNKLIPCYSLRAFDLKHAKDPAKEKLKTGRTKTIPNQIVFEKLMSDHIKEFSLNHYMENLDSAVSSCSVIYPPK